ncbi:MFS transporter [Stenotrophomonas sp. HITSZ_GD]|uniref:MFS transporter n=1 Tax=Stenotrophomonas sp. HITSZ_GD TaxID=3037248 RepID=UPI00240E5004|nr:MFS transporter [Stenotrophomonas sp. HITSZ_GD]MDG2525273.1 MFS transporter [Stenotrophomonas sp. HITSZ_GD]
MAQADARVSVGPSPSSRALEWATRGSFLVAGINLSAWAPLVPYARDRLHAGEAELGLLLLALGVGSVCAMPAAGWAALRLGCRRLIVLLGGLGMLCLPALGFVSSDVGLACVLFVYGAALGGMDVAINLHAVTVERGATRPLMSGFHGCFSVGCILGAGGVAAMLWLGAAPWAAVLPALLLNALCLWRGAPHLLPAGEGGGGWHWPHGRLLLLGGMAFATFLMEGAMLDWSAIAFNTLQQVDTARAGGAYALFALTMTAGRFAGDRWVARHGGMPVLLVGTTLAVGGLALALWTASAAWALAGYAIAGLGAANIAPLAFSAAGRQAGASPQVAVAAVSAMGYSGSLAGPALIGFIAHASSLSLALTCVAAVLAAAVLLGSGSVRPVATGR